MFLKMMTKTMILRTTFLAYVALFSFVSMSKSYPLTETSTITGLTTDLIHRDSPQSPSYDPSLSPSQRIVNALMRSFTRAQHLNDKLSKYAPEPDVFPTGGEYLVKFSIGTPPVASIGIVDTGSDLTWTQCQPCDECFKQSVPIFTPEKSSTYSRVPCNSVNCRSLDGTYCSTSANNCMYNETYGDDGSGSVGELATETFTFASIGGKSLSVPNIVFGCGFSNTGVYSGTESGIVGLGGGKTSLVRELGPVAQGKFSYCLISLLDTSNSSKLHFGSDAEVSGSGVISTPLVKEEPYYYVTLKGISVGNERLEYYDLDSGDTQEGNMIIDSGTTLTVLPSSLYSKLEKAIISSITLKRIQGATNLCYFLPKDVPLPIPEITVHFEGADLKLKQDNIFVRTSNDSLCLAAIPTYDIPIYGNIAQINFLVGYDLVKRTVSFKPTDCGK